MNTTFLWALLIATLFFFVLLPLAAA